MSSKIEVRQKEDGSKGLFATKDMEGGEIIHKLSGTTSNERTRESVEVEENKHITDELFQFCNHSFKENCMIAGLDVYCLESIKKGEEITFDYTLNESEISSPFKDKETGRMVE